MAFDPNAKEYDGEEYQLWHEGWHLVCVQSVEHQTSQSGKPMLHVTYEHIDPFRENQLIGTKLDYQFYMLDPSSKAIRFYAKLCRAVDPSIGPHDLDDIDFQRDRLEGMPLSIRIVHEKTTWDGKPRTRARARGHRQLTSREIARLKEAYGDDLVPPEVSNDEVPF